MLFTTTDPFRQLTSLTQRLDYDVFRSEDGVILSIDIPGIDPSTVELTVEGRSLELSASRQSSIPDDAQVVVRNRRNGSVNQTFQLSERLDSDKLTADYNFGVLTVTIPVAESAKPRKVEVGVGTAPAIDATASEASTDDPSTIDPSTNETV